MVAPDSIAQGLLSTEVVFAGSCRTAHPASSTAISNAEAACSESGKRGHRLMVYRNQRLSSGDSIASS
jgi:hypothetical protein